MRRAVRLLVHLVRLIPLIVLGAVVRFGRKLLGRPPRIWHGLSPLFWEQYLVRSSRKAGYPTRFVLRDHPSLRDMRSDFPELRLLGEVGGIPGDEIHWAALRDLFWRGDIQMAYFDVMYFGPSLRWANELALRLMKWSGIKIVVMAHGGDVTHRARYRSRFDWVGRVQQNNLNWDLVETAPGTIWRIETYCRFADLVLPGDPAMGRFLPRNDLLFKYFPVDTDALSHAPVSDRAVPVVVHAPSARAIKGTEYVLAALDRLREKGIAFELRLIEKTPRPQALEIYRSADLIVDQLCIGAYGTLAVEALSLGKPTLTYLDQEHLGDPLFNVPLVNTNPETIERVLAVLLQVPELRRRLGRASREAAERFHSIDALAEIWKQIFEHLWKRTPLHLESTRQFDPSRKPRSFSEDPASPEFWPVAVDDLTGQIEQALQRVGAQ
jgi:glycosyltransferase involved in cell wall biosynthesis